MEPKTGHYESQTPKPKAVPPLQAVPAPKSNSGELHYRNTAAEVESFAFMVASLQNAGAHFKAHYEGGAGHTIILK